MFFIKKVFLSEIIALTIFVKCLDSSEQSAKKKCIQAEDVCPNEYIKFYLYTNDTPVEIHIDSIEKIQLANSIYDLKILIHGVRGSKDDDFNTFIRNAYFKRRKYNVISVEYNAIARSLKCYNEAVDSASVVGRCLTELLDALLSEHEEIKYVHAIGFSLGAQIAGIVGKLWKEKGKTLNRITALDPALPRFEHLWNILNAECANVVDVIHTNVGVMGQLLPCGTVDFYANGAIIQPGCENSDNSIYCSHGRAYEIYAESIKHGKSSNGFFAMSAAYTNNLSLLGSFYDEIKNYELIGEFFDQKITGLYNFPTNEKPPYAQGFFSYLSFFSKLL